MCYMKRIVMLALCWLVMIISVCAEELVLVSDPFPPYVTGQVGAAPTGGKMVAILQEIFSRVHGLELRMELYPWKRALILVQQGKVDGLMMAMKNEARQKYMVFSDVIFHDVSYLYYMKDHFKVKPSWNTLADLNDYMIGVIKGYYSHDLIEQAITQGHKIKLVSLYEQERGIKMLTLGRLDFVILLHASEKNYEQEYNLQGQLLHMEKPWVNSQYQLTLSKKSKALSFLPRINQVIAEVKADGTIQQIIEEK